MKQLFWQACGYCPPAQSNEDVSVWKSRLGIQVACVVMQHESQTEAAGAGWLWATNSCDMRWVFQPCNLWCCHCGCQAPQGRESSCHAEFLDYQPTGSLVGTLQCRPEWVPLVWK